MIRHWAIISGAAIGLCSTAATADTSFRDWQMSCDDAATGKACVISQTTLAADRTWLGTVQIQVSDGAGVDGDLPLVFKVPEGVHLASGLFVADGSDAPQQAKWLYCEPGVCTAALMLSPAGLAGWKAGNTAEVRYRPRQDVATISFDVSLLGVTAALRAAREAVQ